MPVASSDPDRLWTDAPVSHLSHHHSSTLESAISYVENPFVQQTSLPLARFGGGRFELGGFDILRPTENFLLGPPSSGGLPAWSVGLQVHPAILTPLADESFGVSLSIRIKRDSEPGHPVQFLRCLGWVVGAGRGCHLN